MMTQTHQTERAMSTTQRTTMLPGWPCNLDADSNFADGVSAGDASLWVVMKSCTLCMERRCFLPFPWVSVCMKASKTKMGVQKGVFRWTRVTCPSISSAILQSTMRKMGWLLGRFFIGCNNLLVSNLPFGPTNIFCWISRQSGVVFWPGLQVSVRSLVQANEGEVWWNFCRHVYQSCFSQSTSFEKSGWTSVVG